MNTSVEYAEMRREYIQQLERQVAELQARVWARDFKISGLKEKAKAWDDLKALSDECYKARTSILINDKMIEMTQDRGNFIYSIFHGIFEKEAVSNALESIKG